MLSQAAFMWEHLQGKTCYIVLLRQETDKEDERNSLKASAISFDKIFQVLKRSCFLIVNRALCTRQVSLPIVWTTDKILGALDIKDEREDLLS